MQSVCQMPKIELSFGQRMGKKMSVFMCYSWKHPICKRNSKRRDIRDSASPIYVFSMQRDSVQPGFLPFAVRSIQGNKHICAASLGRKICCFEAVGHCVCCGTCEHRAPTQAGWKWVKGSRDDTFAHVRWVGNVRLVPRNRLWCASAVMGWWHGR